MTYQLNDLVTMAVKKNDEDALLEIINKFMPLIKKYSKRIRYEDITADLIITLIESTVNLSQHPNFDAAPEGRIVAYLAKSIRNKYIFLSKKYAYIGFAETDNFRQEKGAVSYDYESGLFFLNLLDKLSTLQKKVIIYKFVEDMSDVNIAAKLKISRQAVNKTKNRALEKLRGVILME